MFAEAKEFRVPLLSYLLLFDSEISLTHWDGQVRGSLEDLEMAGLWAPSLGYLDTCRTSPNDGTPLALDWNFLVRPERGMMNDTFEFLDPRPIRDVSLGSKAGADHQVLGFSSPAVRGLDVPTPFFSVEVSVDNNTLKGCLTLDVENSVASVKIISQVVVIWIVVRPIVSRAC